MKVSISVCDLQPGESAFVQMDAMVVRLTEERSQIVLDANDGALVAVDNAPGSFSGISTEPLLVPEPEKDSGEGLTNPPPPVVE